jgi:hypothetical protein
MDHPNLIKLTPFMRNRLNIEFSHLPQSELNLRIEEFFKFIYLCSLYGGSHIPLSKEVDEIWHEFILQTEEYYELCMSLPGKRFIHHRSGNLKETVKMSNKTQTIKKLFQWLPIYYKHFGEFGIDQAPLWQVVHFLMTELRLSLKEINEIAKTEAQKI